MSHFITLVILPQGTTMEDVESKTALLLQPYDESIRVSPYETECWCIGIPARIEVEGKVNESFNINQVRIQYHSLPETERTEQKWAELVTPSMELRERLLSEHPMKDKPNPECKSCEGTGNRVTQYNPASKWDWWVIGGRWDGWIFGPEREKASSDEKGGLDFGNEHQRPENNCRRVSEIPIEDRYYVPLAVITPESGWIEQGEVGYWPLLTNAVSNEQWYQTVKAVLSKYPDHLAVAVDCHI